MEDSFTNRGIVTDCLWLDLHESPTKESEVIGRIPCLTEVNVDSVRFNANWYYVMADINPCAVIGYCPKEYIAIA